jgi:hypothetical protein
MAKLDTKIAKLNKDFTITVNVHLTRRLRIRFAFARFLFWLAAKVLGCGIVVKDPDPHKEQS